MKNFLKVITIEEKDIIDPVEIVKNYCKENGLSFFFDRNENIIKKYLNKVFSEQGYTLIAINKNKIREDRERDE